MNLLPRQERMKQMRKKSRNNNADYTARCKLRDYISDNQKFLPDFWKEKGARVCLDGIRCMIARGRHTDAEIAEFYGCEVTLIELVRDAHYKTIAKLKKEHEQMLESFGEMYESLDGSLADREGVLRLLEFIVERRKYEN